MHALSYADQMLLLERFMELLAADKAETQQVVHEVGEWMARLNPGLSHMAGFQRQVHELTQLAEESEVSEVKTIARTGLLYLVRSGSGSPDALGHLGLMAHSFVLSLIIHKARTALGRTFTFVPPELRMEDRVRAEEIFSDALKTPLYEDKELFSSTRAFLEDPGIPVESLFFRRLLRNAEFLLDLLESGDVSDQDAARARAALSYLVLEEDSIDDRLGLIGFLDDAYILDLAVSLIEPARQPWLRLVEAAGDAAGAISRFHLRGRGAEGTQVQGHVLVDAALLSEPMAMTMGPLNSALVVPTAGSTSVLLGLAVVLEMVHGSMGDDVVPFDVFNTLPETAGDEALAKLMKQASDASSNQYVVVAAPGYRCRQLVDDIQLRGKPLQALLPIAVSDEDGQFEGQGLSVQMPVLVLAPSLRAAAQIVERSPDRVRMLLVDLELASGGEVAADSVAPSPGRTSVPEVEGLEDLGKKKAKPKKAKRAKTKSTAERENYDVLNAYLGETGFIPRLTREQENRLSVEMIEGRRLVMQGVLRIGRSAVLGLSTMPIENMELFEQLKVRVAGGSSNGLGAESVEEECIHLMQELQLEDSHYAHVVDHLRPQIKRVRGLLKRVENAGPSSKAGVELEAAQLETELGVGLSDFLEGYKMMREGCHRVDNAVGLLTRGNLRLVLWMAKKYRNRNTFFLDMVQEGNMGLMRAARKFDHGKGASFGTYANWWVRQAIERYLSHHARTIRIPVTALNSLRRVRDAVREMAAKGEDNPSAEVIAKMIGMDRKEVRRIMRVAHDLEHGCVALDGPMDSESGTTLGDMLADPSAALPLDELSMRQLGDEARKLLDTLEPLEAKVLRMRFGIGNDKRHTLEQIGNQVGLTRERIRQIEIKALGKLRFRAKRLGVRP